MGETIFWGAAGVLALVVMGFFALLAGKQDRKHPISPLLVFTIGVFVALVVLYLPAYLMPVAGQGIWLYLCQLPRNLVEALFVAMRVIILEGDPAIIAGCIAGQPAWLQVAYTSVVTVLLVVAPLLTFGNILAMFKGFGNTLRLMRCGNKQMFVFSQLNPKSIAIAQSLALLCKSRVILPVFTGVGEDADPELLEQAEELNAICLKRAVTQLDIQKRKGAVEMFFISENEDENVSQAVRIAQKLEKDNSKFNVKLFVFSKERSAGYILDSLDCPNLRKHAKEHKFDESTFQLRRVDEVRQLAWNTLPNLKVFEVARKHDNVISVLLAGLGHHGMEFFKALCWYCQFEGYKLKLTLVDMDPALEDRIQHSCPDLLRNNRSEVDGDCWYDILCVPGVDIASQGLESFLRYEGFDPEKLQMKQRLQEVNFALVALGDDDRNIQVAVELRGLFDRLHAVRAKEDIQPDQEAVQLYAVVYDAEKTGLLGEDAAARVAFLRNQQKVPYHIHFIGALAEEFSYGNVYNRTLEAAGLEHHVQWVKLKSDITEKKRAEELLEEQSKYEQFEYFRHSSIASELYAREVDGNKAWETGDKVLQAQTVCIGTGDRADCTCEHCGLRKRSEHMRWNAYTRILGYSKSAYRADRAMLHDKLVGWSGLDPRYKRMD